MTRETTIATGGLKANFAIAPSQCRVYTAGSKFFVFKFV